jgi:hypothetical protein
MKRMLAIKHNSHDDTMLKRIRNLQISLVFLAAGHVIACPSWKNQLYVSEPQ